MRRLRAFLLAAALAVTAVPAFAIAPDEQLDDPALEARARALSKKLRCVVCQSESIDESNASMAQDLRRLVRERIVAGDTDQEILDYVATRYGDYVLLEPRKQGPTLMLWGAPLIFIALGGALLVVVLRQARRTPIDDDDAPGAESSA